MGSKKERNTPQATDIEEPNPPQASWIDNRTSHYIKYQTKTKLGTKLS